MPESTRLTLVTQPATFKGSLLDKVPMPFERLIGIRFANVSIGPRSDTETQNHLLRVPSYFAERLSKAIVSIESGDPMNCHRFSRIMTDTESLRGGWDNKLMSYSDINGRNRVNALAMGKLGLIGSEEDIYGTRHSLIGMGEDNPYSIQVMSGDRDLGIARYDDVLAFYRRTWLGDKIALFSTE